MRYLQSTIDVGLTFNGSGNEDVADVSSDADFATCVSMKSVFRHGCADVRELCFLVIQETGNNCWGYD